MADHVIKDIIKWKNKRKNSYFFYKK
jgi:hypothetical protein